MRGLIWLVIIAVTYWLMKSRKSRVPEGTIVNDPLTAQEKVLTWVYCFFNPLISGGILYYGWRRKLPVKAKQSNRISFMVFFLQIVIAVSIMLVMSRTKS